MTVALRGVPYDGASSYQRGAAKAPPAIRAALRNESSNSWSESLEDTSAPGFITDGRDLVLDRSPDPFGAIQAAVSHLLDLGHAPLVLGGDHSITLPVLRALRPRYRPLTVLHVDAHPDLYDEFEGDRYSHACPFARVMEEGLADRLVQVGIRTMNRHQREQADRFGTEIIEMKDWRDGWRLEADGAVYLSFDMDGLDPASAPGVSHPEPGGFTTRQVLGLIQSVDGLVGADLVEFNPENDLRDLTARVAAKLVKELACAIHRRRDDSPTDRSRRA
jgi:agmatinase